jgi:DNA polymerase-3 subunit delta
MGMQALEFLRLAVGPAAPAVRPIYAVFGDDAYLKREAVAGIVRIALGPATDELTVARFAGEQAALADVLDEVRTLPFLAPRRVVLVENADPFVTAHRKELEQFAEHPATSGVLVLNVKSWTSTTRLAKQVDQVGLAIDCKSPRSSELPGWLIALARDRYNLRLEAEAGKLLVELAGDEIGVLISEIDKLAAYVGKRTTIARADVAKLVGAGRVEDVWRMLDHATTGKPAQALHDLDRLLGSGEAAVGLLAAMSASLRKVHHAGQLRRARVDLRQACREAGIPPFAGEATQRQHAHLGPTRVDRLPQLLLQADLDLKGATMLTPRAVLERFLLHLALPRED